MKSASCEALFMIFLFSMQSTLILRNTLCDLDLDERAKSGKQ